MPSASKNDVPITSIGGYEGRFVEWGGLKVAFETIPAGTETAPMFEGLPENRCHCPHWGFLFKGKAVVRYKDHEEIITGGQAYYLAPGHTAFFEEDAEGIEFSPVAELERTLEVYKRNIAAGGADGPPIRRA